MKTNLERIQTRLFAGGLLMLAAAMLVVSCAKDDDDGGDPAPAGATQIDRMAVPGVNTALISTASKDSFNQGDPTSDVGLFAAMITTNITGLRTAVGGIAGFPAEDSPGITATALTGVVCPDVVTIDFSQTVQFPNGRRLQDDVMDAVLGLVLNRGNALGGGGGIPDTINTNDVAFGSTFPYLANPNP